MLPELLRAFCGTPHASAGETVNMLMLGQELRLPDLLMSNPLPRTYQSHSEYLQEIAERLEEVHTLLKEQQIAMRKEDDKEPLLNSKR